MNTYEMTLVLTEEAGKSPEKAQKQATDLVSQFSGQVKSTKIIGMRDLAYPIKKHTRGWYGIFRVELTADKVADLDKAMRLNEKIIRYLLVKTEGLLPAKKAETPKKK